MADKLAVIGMGLIGGSVALGARAADPARTVIGFDRDRASLKDALERGALSVAADSAEAAVAEADLVVLALPVDRIPSACRQLAEVVPRGGVVTDVGSAKGEVAAVGGEAFGARFVGGHPMAGSERHGFGAADPRLFEGASWLLTPTEETSPEAYSTVVELVTGLGATPIAVGPDIHDALVARLSHVPQLTASALVEVAAGSGEGDALLGLAAGGFRDVTRIAASNPDLWVAILRSNRAAILEALSGLRNRLGDVAAMISGNRWEDLRAWLDTARSARVELFAKPDYGGEPVALQMMIPDRPGVLAEVTTVAGELGINLEDIEIFHSTEGGRGRLELVVAGSDRADVLGEALAKLGYVVERGVLE